MKSQIELENAVLEVFARAFEPRARLVYDGIRPYEHFLMGIARNYLLEQARSREYSAGLSPSADEIERTLAATDDVHQSYEDREVEALLAEFMAGLTDEERNIYALRFNEGLAQEAAADKLGITRIQLRRRELHLKKRLLGHLKAKGYLRDISSSGWGFVKKQVEQ